MPKRNYDQDSQALQSADFLCIVVSWYLLLYCS